MRKDFAKTKSLSLQDSYIVSDASYDATLKIL